MGVSRLGPPGASAPAAVAPHRPASLPVTTCGPAGSAGSGCCQCASCTGGSRGSSPVCRVCSDERDGAWAAMTLFALPASAPHRAAAVGILAVHTRKPVSSSRHTWSPVCQQGATRPGPGRAPRSGASWGLALQAGAAPRPGARLCAGELEGLGGAWGWRGPPTEDARVASGKSPSVMLPVGG